MAEQWANWLIARASRIFERATQVFQKSQGLLPNAEDHRGQGDVLWTSLQWRTLCSRRRQGCWHGSLALRSSNDCLNCRELSLFLHPWGSHPSVGAAWIQLTDYWEGERDKGMANSVQIWTLLKGHSSCRAPCGGQLQLWVVLDDSPISLSAQISSFHSLLQTVIPRVPFNTHSMAYTPVQRLPSGKPNWGKDIFVSYLMSGMTS